MKEDKSFIELIGFSFWCLILKIKAELGVLFITFMSFISPIYGLFVLVGGMVALDTTAGIYIAKKNNTYTSNNLFNIVVKTFFYMGTILLAFFVDKYIISKNELLGIPYFMSKITAIFWTYIEAKSLDEKSQKLGNQPFTTIVSNLIKWIKSVKKDINEIKE